MTTQEFGRQRPTPMPVQTPANTPVQPDAGATDTPENKPLPVDAVPLQVNAGATDTPSKPDKEYEFSVEQAQKILAGVGLQRSKDTVQRLCRDGSLDARKLGVLRRYFITRQSLDLLIEQMKPDAGADTRTQVHEAEDTPALSFTQVHETAPEKETAEDIESDAGADTRTQVHADASTEKMQVAVLEAKLEATETLNASKDKMISFLMEEVKENRGNRSDVTNIAERMLATLETMAIGGRLRSVNRDDDPRQAEPAVEVVPMADEHHQATAE